MVDQPYERQKDKMSSNEENAKRRRDKSKKYVVDEEPLGEDEEYKEELVIKQNRGRQMRPA